MNGVMHILDENIELLAQPVPPAERPKPLPPLNYAQRMAWLQALRASFAAVPFSSYSRVQPKRQR